MDTLDEYRHEPCFRACWHAFERACALLVLPALPPDSRAQADHWMAAADAVDRGSICASQLATVRIDAWRFHNERSRTASLAELSALRAVMSRLGDPDWEDWHLDAHHFLEWVLLAGVPERQWFPVLRANFAQFLN